MLPVFLAGVFVFCLCGTANGKPSLKTVCRDEGNTETDWYILYKLPKDSKSSNEFIRQGEAYAKLDVNKGSWAVSKYSVEDEDSNFANTYNQLISGNDKISYLLYNDQLPDSNVSTTYWGHTKGILATDGTTGFWFSHSIPRFPSSPEGDNYDYPDNAKNNGQTAICISFKVKELPKIINHLSYTMPKIYANQSSKTLAKQPEEVRNFFTGSPKFVKKAPWHTVNNLSSIAGQDFKIFAKHGKWDQDIYNSSVGPELHSSLYVQSWMSGQGNKLVSECDKIPFSVLNVNSIKLQMGKSAVSFMRTQDHSKWAASLKGFEPWVCIGDINRMESQFKRGGGAICINSDKVWKAYHSSIDNYEDCPA